jgi:tetratricopeptide (TPR) repeat protein
VTFWALGEIVKAQAGILETDDPAVASAKIDDAVPAGPDRDWLRQRLRPLIGVEVSAGAGAEREELFAAWRTFLETVAEQSPTVLVFEDIHWADDAMLAFLEHLADRAEGVPLLLVATARPELFERHATFAAGLPNVNRINLAPLTDEETSRLVAGRLGAAVPQLQGPILEQAEGNPLYAEEFVRLLRDRDLLTESDGTVALRPGAEVPLPESIGALIAARLDTLPAERKAMLADAAVVGKVFWAGAVAAMGEREVADVNDAMRGLARKELVRAARHSSMAGETEYAFWHVLVRDVAYAQLPRASRAARHVAAAEWLDAKAGDRSEDIAEVLAHHYATALDLTRAAGRAEQASELQAQALRFLVLAGGKAMYLDVPTAMADFEKALSLTPPGHEARPEVLARFGEAARETGRNSEASTALEEATQSFRERGDLRAAARSMLTQFGVLQDLGDPRQWTILLEAAAMLEPLPPSQELLDVLARIAGNQINQGHDDEALATAGRVLALATEHGLARPPLALRTRGLGRVDRGDMGGFDDLREAIRLGIDAGGRGVPAAYNDLAYALGMVEGPRAALDVMDEAIAFGAARGLTSAVDMLTAGTLGGLFEIGAFDATLRGAVESRRRAEAHEDTWVLMFLITLEAMIHAMRGTSASVSDELDWLEQTSRRSEALQSIVPSLAASAVARASLGQMEASRALLVEVAELPGSGPFTSVSGALPALVRTAIQIGDLPLADRFVAASSSGHPYGQHMILAARAAVDEGRGGLAVAADEYADAAHRWERFGVVPEEAFALLGQGRCLLGLGRSTEAMPVLQRARAMFERLGAIPALAETDGLLEQAPRDTARTP